MNLNRGIKIFRFDDVSVNSDMSATNAIAEYLRSKCLNCQIIYCVSPLVHSNCGERVFPKIINAHSSLTRHYRPDRCGVPALPDYVTVASHGLLHEDHRLLNYAAQEMSILISCSLSKSKIFVPPFNKWDEDTFNICERNQIDLVKFEDGWRSLEHNPYDEKHNIWYLHAREWTLDKIKNWFGE